MGKLKSILYLSYYFEPDLSAGSFRNTALAKALANELSESLEIQLICTVPNRYKDLNQKAALFEKIGKLNIHRIPVHQHGNRFIDQIISFWQYRQGVVNLTRSMQIHSIFASSSKLFTAHLAYIISKKYSAKLYLDIRDIFTENIKELVTIPLLNNILSWFLRNFIEQPTFLHASHININSEGFKKNIPKSKWSQLTFYPNGIDDDFLQLCDEPHLKNKKPIICYAGNIGTGQGLEKIIPFAAKELENTHIFWVIGDGSTKNLLKEKIEELQVRNVTLFSPVRRVKLLQYYHQADYLLLHVNNFKSFEKVIPSKLFEYGASNKPILAGVSGYTRTFIEEQLRNNYFIFDPCDGPSLVNYLKNDEYKLEKRSHFIETFNRQRITTAMVQSLKNVLDI